MALTKKQENSIEECFIIDIRPQEAAKMVNCHVKTIRERYELFSENRKLVAIKNRVQKAKYDKYEDIVDMIRNDTRSLDVVNTIMDVWTNEDYIKTLVQEGRHSDINRIYGTVTDKGIKVREVSIKERQLQLEEESNNVVNIKIVDDLGDLDE